MRKKFSAHCCLLDSDCRYYGAPNRLYIFTPWFGLYVGWKEFETWRR